VTPEGSRPGRLAGIFAMLANVENKRLHLVSQVRAERRVRGTAE
jgi:hypothetical protein